MVHHMSKELTKAAKLLGKAGGKIGGKIGGRSRSEAKLAAARANGKKGGKPRKAKGDAPSFLINVYGIGSMWQWRVSDMGHKELDGGTERTKEDAMNAAANCVTSLSIQAGKA